MDLSSKNVEQLMMKCLFTSEELEEVRKKGDKHPQEAVVVKGIIHTFGFHPERLKSCEQDVVKMLQQLPAEFHEGYSFLKAPFNAKMEQWGEHRDAEALLSLGMGLGYVKECLPEMFRSSLPGGVPYYQVTV